MRTYIPKGAKLVPEEAEKVFSGHIFDIYQWQQEMFDGSLATFEMVKRTDTVNIIAIRDDKIVIVNDEQPGRTARTGFPGGRHDRPEETELEAAKRELLEETGLSFKNWKLVRCVEPITATNKIEWLLYTFVAFDFESEAPPSLDAGEKIEVSYVSYDELLKLSSSEGGGHLLEYHSLIESAGSVEGLKSLPDISTPQ
jgi:8-oxo-dGTP pyrophosphatase MutT (NUDIX family)